MDRMRIIIFAEKFANGAWDVWEYTCSSKEAKTILNSALMTARFHASDGPPNHTDLLETARRIFNGAHGTEDSPKEGDRRVYCICVEETVVGVCEKIRQYSQRIIEAHQFAEIALRKSA
jgi:hypothetical protein